jgi:polar amino acid transport system permease protein
MTWTPSPRQLEREAIVRRLRWRRSGFAATATVVGLGLLVALVVTSSGWPRVHETFFSWHYATDSFPSVIKAIRKNIEMFCIAEPLILIVAILVAVTRQTVSPWLAPLRVLAVLYADLFRGIPMLLVVTFCALGIPALQLHGLTNNPFWLTLGALVISYGAYVSEVIRAGIESVHPTQVASAQALALSRSQTMWHVVLPQGIRRVVPPLMNDFVSLQKDTSLVSVAGVWEAMRAASDYAAYQFNYTSLVVAAVLFIVLTVPLVRLTDWLTKRALRRQWGIIS